MDIKTIKERLIEGNKRFVADRLDGKLQNSSRRDELTQGQQPHTIVLSCADSRVVPELAFDAGLGELFVVRVAGNIANTDSIASMEYAVAHCGSKLIVVMGHQNCGAVTAAIQGGDNGYNLNHLLSHINPAIAAVEADSCVNEVVKQHAIITREGLLDRSSIIRDAYQAKKIDIVSAYYSLETGAVEFL